jgi:hypothetical protein
MQQRHEALTASQTGSRSRSESSIVAGLAPAVGVRGGGLPDLDAIAKVRRAFAQLTDRQAAWALGAVLFVVGAWPLALVEVPPFQDLPNHLAAVTVIRHPEHYPEFVFNGFFKTNASLFSWLYFVGGVIGEKLAARVFALLVLAGGAFVLPQFILRFTNRQRMIVASLLCWPMVHNWFVSMGMLDFALGVPLSLLVLMAIDAHRKAPTWKTGLVVFGLSFATWYSHVFGLLVVGMLGLIHAASQRGWRERWREALLVFGPQVPVIALTGWSLYVQLTEPTGAMHGFVALRRLLPPWELFYNMFAEWTYGFTWLSVTSLVPTLVIPFFAFWRRWERPTFFGPVAFVALWALYFATPYVATNWFHVNSRFIPFLWVAMLLRVPDRIDRRLAGALAACAVAYSVGMGVDYVRLDRDHAKVTAGIPAVPEGARLLPLIFNQKGTSENTRSMLHTWGYYVTEKQTSAPLLFAHSRSFPVMYRTPPPIQFNHLVLEAFASTMRSPEWECSMLRVAGIVEPDCAATWRERWAEFWRQVTPQFDHVLMWEPPREVLALVPPNYRLTFSQDRLAIFERVSGPPSPSAAADDPPVNAP